MAHGILVPSNTAAMNVDAWRRNAVSASDVDNGNVVKLTTKSTTSGESEVFTAVVPSTSEGLTNLWFVYEPAVVVTYSGASAYKGLDPDVRNFYTKAGLVFSVFKPQTSDIITLSADAIAGTYVASGSPTTHINATNSTGGLKLLWGTSQTASVLSLKLLAVEYFSLADGSIGTQRITSYQFEVVGL